MTSLTVEVMVEAEAWAAVVADAEEMAMTTLAAALAELPAQPRSALDVSVTFGDDAMVQDLNERFRGEDKPTNVLSFPALDADELSAVAAGRPLPAYPPGMPVMLGDIMLAFETVSGEAEAQNKPFMNHLRHLLVHGFLHLLGYDHIEDDEAEIMEALERVILARLGVPDPYRPDSALCAYGPDTARCESDDRYKRQ